MVASALVRLRAGPVPRYLDDGLGTGGDISNLLDARVAALPWPGASMGAWVVSDRPNEPGRGFLMRRRPVVPWHGVRIPQDLLGDGHPVDFVGDVVETSKPGVPVHTLEREVATDAGGAVNLDRPVCHVLERSCRVELHQ